MRGFWTCQRITNGVKCGASNPNRVRNCTRCGKPRAARRPPAHMCALKLSREYYEVLNGGRYCGICRATDRKLYRDHEHKDVGTPRGLLCFRCNAALRDYMDLEWLRAAVEYLERVEERRGGHIAG